MPQLRQNIVTKEWVIIATERAKRPDQLKEDRLTERASLPEHDENCPFCTKDVEKPPMVLPAACGEVLVVPNKYPALGHGDEWPPFEGTTVFPSMEAVGRHEVIIETPVHNLTLATMQPGQVECIVNAYLNRYETLLSLPMIESAIIFRNHGSRAGASLIHPHSQAIGLPIIPRDIMTRITESIRYHVDHRECVFCRLIADELDGRHRIVTENEDFVAFIPFAAYSPFHLWIFPKKHESDFRKITPGGISHLSAIIRDVMRRLYYGLNDPDYNLILRSAPKGYTESAFFHWYVTLVPRLTRTAGFELGSGMFINPSIPEENAEYLRSINLP